MTRTDRYRSSGTASVLRCQRTPFRSTIAVLHCPRFRSTGRGKYREGKRRGAGMGAERGTHATGVTTGATGVGGLAGQLTAGARRTSQVTYSAMGSPLATSGRFCRRIQPERPRSGSVSPGQRSRQRTTPAENRTETKDPWQNQGPFPAEPPRSRMATVNANRGAEVCSERGLRLAKLHPEHTSVPCSPDQRHLNAGHPLSVCESFPARLLHGGLQRPDRPSMRSGCPSQDP